ncbi:Na+/H+ antiporter NhaA [Aestuariibacter sp. AA17]|uniref:Na(+)/H(+) antiporter NhaA n=1 Tax=Fluctibacter corallii TaxID=2984329 RepID=A0ABT3A796_9ALTE|nr:Na+/H+ antiporter NhaA [Aestuariibacter sp. AA17]MCV2884546.1 Na+/H+ antiporter NhaA [Aestuariibacter sp. AA17]
MVTKLPFNLSQDAASGVVLVGAALLAMLFANTPLSVLYTDFLEIPVVIKFGGFEIAKPLLLWINDGLMAVFFFMIGLEIKRELMEGHLSSPSQVILPGIAAVAGIVFPALVYAYFNQHDPIAIKGWAIPSATDIAFALGVFALFGKSLPTTLKLFLLSVAIFDDIGAIIIIAIFYSQDLSTLSLTIALCGLVILFILNQMNMRRQAMYILVGVVVWAAVLKSGVHATLAGFALAWFIPLKLQNEDGHAMLPHLEHKLHPWVAFFILPIFAFANAGVSLAGAELDLLFNSVTLGIALGLFLGKQVGIFSACWLAVKMRIAPLPKGTNFTQLYGVTLLCGIGFTMSLFIGTLAFANQDLAYQLNVKVGVLAGSIMSAILGAAVLYFSSRQSATNQHLSRNA